MPGRDRRGPAAFDQGGASLPSPSASLRRASMTACSGCRRPRRWSLTVSNLLRDLESWRVAAVDVAELLVDEVSAKINRVFPGASGCWSTVRDRPVH